MIATTNTGPRKLDISVPTSEFMKMARSWESYQNEIMGIAVRHIKKSVNMYLLERVTRLVALRDPSTKRFLFVALLSRRMYSRGPEDRTNQENVRREPRFAFVISVQVTARLTETLRCKKNRAKPLLTRGGGV
jgi:hypothetical protein